MEDKEKLQWLFGICIALFLLLIFSISVGYSTNNKAVKLQKEIDNNNKQVEDQKTRMFKLLKLLPVLMNGPIPEISDDKINCQLNNMSKKYSLFEVSYSFVLLLTFITIGYVNKNNIKEGKPPLPIDTINELIKMIDENSKLFKNDMDDIAKICGV